MAPDPPALTRGNFIRSLRFIDIDIQIQLIMINREQRRHFISASKDWMWWFLCRLHITRILSHRSIVKCAIMVASCMAVVWHPGVGNVLNAAQEGGVMFCVWSVMLSEAEADNLDNLIKLHYSTVQFSIVQNAECWVMLSDADNLITW